MWDERYRDQGYLFGTEPADFLRRAKGVLVARSQVLCIADGEGRNSVHLAASGHHVVAMDASAVGVRKARALAGQRGVDVDFRLAQIEDWEWQPDTFDAVCGIFIQFAGPDQRRAIHTGIAQTLRPGGIVLLHGYGPRQIGYGTGGPGRAENLYVPEALASDFPGWEVLVSADYDADLSEGTRHVGKSALIDFIARKPDVTTRAADLS